MWSTEREEALMKTGIVRICSAVAINIKGGRPLCASPSSDHFMSYNHGFYGSFKPGFIVRRCLQRGVTPGTEARDAWPRRFLCEPRHVRRGVPPAKGRDGEVGAAGDAGWCALMGLRGRCKTQRGDPAKPDCEDLRSCSAAFPFLS